MLIKIKPQTGYYKIIELNILVLSRISAKMIDFNRLDDVLKFVYKHNVS